MRKFRARHVWLVPGSRKGWHRAVWTQDGENPHNKSNALPSERKQGPWTLASAGKVLDPAYESDSLSAISSSASHQ